MAPRAAALPPPPRRPMLRLVLRLVLGLVLAAARVGEAARQPRAGPAAPVTRLAGCVVRPTVALAQNATCAGLGPNATMGKHGLQADLAAARGESEQFQVFIEGVDAADPPAVALEFSALTPVGAADGVADGVAGALCGEGEDCWSWWQVGYVFCNETRRVAGSGGGWRPDPLLPPEAGGVRLERGMAQPLFVRFRAPDDAAPGRYAGSLWVVDGRGYRLRSFFVFVTVWDFALPPPGQGAWDTLFSFGFAPSAADAAALHPPHLTPATKRAWFDLLSAHRVPPENLYRRQVADPDDVAYLAAAGQRLINLRDVSKAVDAQGKPVDLCASVSQAYIDGLLAELRPLVRRLERDGLLDRAYVYGFDEAPVACNATVRRLFGAVKAAFPGLRTAATVGAWDDLPWMEPDVPIDVWVRHVTRHNATAAAAWVEKGRSYMLYHSIEPAAAGTLNTFIERGPLEPRLLMWFGAGLGEAVSGWLYYAVDAFATGCSVNPAPHRPLRRLGGTARTDFNPGNCIWWPKYDYWANGDGQLVYPGAGSAPVGSMRLANLLDGLEDVELLRRLADPAALVNATRRVVRGLEDWEADPGVLEAVRREVAEAVAAEGSVRRLRRQGGHDEGGGGAVAR